MGRNALVCVGMALVFGTVHGCSAGNSGNDYGKAPDASVGGQGAGGDAGTDSGPAGFAGEAGMGDGGVGAGGQGGAGEAGASGSDAAVDVDLSYDAPTADVEMDACATASAEGQPIPLDIYLMQDSTGSMSLNLKWSHCVTAINGFVTSPSQTGNQLALKFFDSDISADCTGAYYATPDVPLTALPVPGGNNPIQQALSAHSPGGNTPTEGALRGIAQYTSSHQKPGRTMIGIIVTDGDPTDCDTDIGNLKNIISQHYNATGIRTFVVGMIGATFSNLEQWAIAGGGLQHANYCSVGINPCHFYNVGNGDPQAFIAALQQIQKNAVACSYQFPKTDAGLVDPAQVKVTYTPGNGDPPQELTRVQDATQCVPGGWYYDNPGPWPPDPKTINLCPQTCNVVLSDTNAKIDIALGCLGS
ncbi:MAG: VWA domain-containing protein [Deltaproteobacteria bacterium]|nr:VWA domain-containing protein [Deltaproteobacteria bacterium]